MDDYKYKAIVEELLERLKHTRWAEDVEDVVWYVLYEKYKLGDGKIDGDIDKNNDIYKGVV